MTVHILFHGRSFCNMVGMPGQWPDGHLWTDVENAEKATCQTCIETCIEAHKVKKEPVTSQCVYLTRDYLRDCPVKMWFGERPHRGKGETWHTDEPHRFMLIQVEDFCEMFRRSLLLGADEVLEIEIKWKEVSRVQSK